MTGSSYMDQYKRMIRFFKKFEKINEGKVQGQGSDENLDDVYSFFIHCYHLKDWIKNDAASGINSATVEAFINGDLNLEICADICNGVKHLNLHSPRIGAEMQGSYLSVNTGGTENITREKYPIEVSGTLYNAFDVAKKSVEAWRNFLSSYIVTFTP